MTDETLQSPTKAVSHATGNRARRRHFIVGFDYLFPTSDTMTVKCWRAVRSTLYDDDLDRLIEALLVAAKAKYGVDPLINSHRPETSEK